jgi:hypothetical protein
MDEWTGGLVVGRFLILRPGSWLDAFAGVRVCWCANQHTALRRPPVPPPRRSAVTFATVGYGDIHAQTVPEAGFIVLYIYFNVFIGAYIIGEVGWGGAGRGGVGWGRG